MRVPMMIRQLCYIWLVLCVIGIAFVSRPKEGSDADVIYPDEDEALLVEEVYQS